MVSVPETIKALQVQDDRTVKVIDLPFASQEKVKNLPEDQVLVRSPTPSSTRVIKLIDAQVRVRVVGLNPTDWKARFAWDCHTIIHWLTSP